MYEKVKYTCGMAYKIVEGKQKVNKRDVQAKRSRGVLRALYGFHDAGKVRNSINILSVLKPKRHKINIAATS